MLTCCRSMDQGTGDERREHLLSRPHPAPSDRCRLPPRRAGLSTLASIEMNKPCSEACLNNREPILRIIEPLLEDCATVLEIGSGTGQHAVHFAAHLPHLTWLTSDLPANHTGINAWLEEAGLANLPPPLALDVRSENWHVGPVDAIFSANSAHIMDEPAVAAMIEGVGRVLRAGGPLLLYGPFRYQGRHTSDSNREFDRWLRQRDPRMGVRDLDWLEVLARDAGLTLENDVAMPANNRTLVWRKQG